MEGEHAFPRRQPNTENSLELRTAENRPFQVNSIPSRKAARREKPW
jgi:hypothetical protein